MKKPGIAAHILCFLLSFVLMAALLGGSMLFLANRATNDAGLYLAAGEQVMDDRMETLAQVIDTTAEQYSFSPRVLDDIVTKDVLRAQEKVMIDWLLAMFHGTASSTAPMWYEPAVAEAIRTDEQFQEAVAPAMQKIVARDQAGFAVTNAVSNAILPLRADVIRMGLGVVESKYDIPAMINLIPTLMWAALIGAAVLCALMLLMMFRRFASALLYIGSACIAAVLVMLCAGYLVYSIGIPAICAQMSALFAKQVSALLTQLAISGGIIAALLLAVGILMMHLGEPAGKKE